MYLYCTYAESSHLEHGNSNPQLQMNLPKTKNVFSLLHYFGRYHLWVWYGYFCIFFGVVQIKINFINETKIRHLKNSQCKRNHEDLQ